MGFAIFHLYVPKRVRSPYIRFREVLQKNWNSFPPGPAGLPTEVGGRSGVSIQNHLLTAKKGGAYGESGMLQQQSAEFRKPEKSCAPGAHRGRAPNTPRLTR